MPITDGKVTRSSMIGRSRVVTETELKRAYERLRKRSYRRHQNADWIVNFDDWSYLDHSAYVDGVKDALKEIMR